MSGQFSNQPKAFNSDLGPYSGTEYSVIPLAASLGVQESPAQVIEALKQLCTTLFIRYGIGPRDPECARAIDLPDSQTFRERPNGVTQSDSFNDLLGRLSLPAKGMLVFDNDATIRLPAPEQIEIWKAHMRELSNQHKGLSQIPKDLADAIPKHAISSTLESLQRASDSAELVPHLVRQLKLFHLHGPEWTRISPAESEFLSRYVPGLTSATLPRRELEQRLAQYGLVLQKSETTKKFGPTLEHSRLKKGTLFDMSSYYFRDLIDKKGAGGRLPEPQRSKFRTFLKELKEAVSDKEQGKISNEKWRERQAAAFKKLLR
jgi:hypothetical protein